MNAPDVPVLLGRLRSGNTEAARVLYEQFAPRLIEHIHGRLHGSLRFKVDVEEVVQSAFRCLFRRLADHPLKQDNEEGLWALLVHLAIGKCRRQISHLLDRKHDIRREVARVFPGEEEDCLEPLAREPLVEEEVIRADLLQHLLQQLPGDSERTVLRLELEGYSLPEIAQQVGLTPDAVRSMLARICQCLRGQELPPTNRPLAKAPAQGQV